MPEYQLMYGPFNKLSRTRLHSAFPLNGSPSLTHDHPAKAQSADRTSACSSTVFVAFSCLSGG